MKITINHEALGEADAELVRQALYALRRIKLDAFEIINTASREHGMITFRPQSSDFAIPQIDRLIDVIESGP